MARVCFLLMLLGFLLGLGCAPSRLAAETPRASTVHQQVENILQRPEYQRWQARESHVDSGTSWLESLRQRLRRFLEKLFSREKDPSSSRADSAPGGWKFPISHGVLRILGWIFLGGILLGAAVVLRRAWRDAQTPRISSGVLSREQITAALQQGDARALSGDQWLGEAQRLAQRQDFRAMYRALYLALLSGLHARQQIDFDPHHTNWIYVQRYRGAEAERAEFAGLTELFDTVWYGLQSGDGRDFTALQQRVRALITPVAGTSPEVDRGA